MSSLHPVAPTVSLTPPEALVPVREDQTTAWVSVKPERLAEIDRQAGQTMDRLMSADLHSPLFKDTLNQALAVGRQEMSALATLLQSRSLALGFAGVEDTPAVQAISELRGHLDQLNPGHEGDLLAPRRLLGFIPWGNKLQAYFRRYQTVADRIKVLMGQVYAARDGMQKSLIDLDAQRDRVWAGMQQMAEAIHLAKVLDARLADRVEALQATDPLRANALAQEALFYVRQNLSDMLTQQAVGLNGYLALDVIRKTARELMNGCTRVATTGMSALAVAQTVARATGHQAEATGMLQAMGGTIGQLVQQTGGQLQAHVARTREFTENPVLGIEAIQQMFDQTYQAMDAMDHFRSSAITVLGRNQAMLQNEMARSSECLDRAKTIGPER